MGEYVFYRQRKVKIGSCEELMFVSFSKYLSAVKQDQLRHAENNAPPLLYALPKSESMFRIPYPDEDSLGFGVINEGPDRAVKCMISAETYALITGRHVDAPINIQLSYQKLFTDEASQKLVLGVVIGTPEGFFRVRTEQAAIALKSDIDMFRNDTAGNQEEYSQYDQLMGRIMDGYHMPFPVLASLQDKHALSDRAVMVHPELTTDPYDCRGRTGTVIGVYTDNHSNLDALVNFSGEKLGLYSSDAIITLAPKSVIQQGLASNAGKLSSGERKAILGVLQLQRSGKHAQALSTACEQAVTRLFCTTDCSQWMQMITAMKDKKQQKKLRRK